MLRSLLVLTLAISIPVFAQELPFIAETTLDAFASELSGESAKRNLEGIARHHRMRGSKQYRAAAELVVAEL